MNNKSNSPLSKHHPLSFQVGHLILWCFLLFHTATIFGEGGGYGGAVNLVLKSNYLDKAELWKISPYPNLSPSILLYNQNIFSAKVLPELTQLLPRINGKSHKRNETAIVAIQEDTIIVQANKVKKIILKTGEEINKNEIAEIPSELFTSLALVISKQKILFLPKTNIYIDQVVLDNDLVINFYPYKGEGMENSSATDGEEDEYPEQENLPSAERGDKPTDCISETGTQEENLCVASAKGLAIPIFPNLSIPTVLNNTQSLKAVRRQVNLINRDLAARKNSEKLNLTVDDAIVIPLSQVKTILLLNGKQISPDNLTEIHPRVRSTLALKLGSRTLTVYPRLNFFIKKISLRMGRSISFNTHR